MTLTELRYIIAVGKEKHFGRAADACFVSQPTLSVGVRKLEEQLGAQLFERCGNEVRVTPFGEQIISQAQKVMAEVTTLKDIAMVHKDQLVGPIRLGAIYTIGPYLFPNLTPKLHQLAPKMPIIIQEDFTENFREKLREGEIDIVILALPFVEPGIVTLPLYDEPFIVALPKEHPWENKTVINPTELANENLLLLKQGNCFRDQVLQVCPRCQDNLTEKQYIGSSLETLRYMVASGVGVTILPNSAINAARETNIIYRPFAQPVPQRRIALAWRQSFPRLSVIDVLSKAILACELSGINKICLNYTTP